MNRRGLFLLLPLIASQAWAQNDPAIEIHGVVTEVGLNLGLAGAEVTIFEFAGPERDRRVAATNVTGPRGEFSFHPVRFGDYYIEVKKPAYVGTISAQGSSYANAPTESTGTLVSVGPAHPSQEVRLTLMRPGSLTGTVTDENDQPVSGMSVEVTLAGLPALARATAATGKDGSFTAKNLIPGEYLVKVSRGPFKLLAMMPKFSEDDLKVVDEEPQTVYWPDAPDEKSANPVRVNPGVSTSLGTTRMRITPSYRARVSIAGCKPDDLPYFNVATPSDGQVIVQNAGAVPVLFLSSANVTSCEDFLVRGLKPGSYTFLLSNKRAWAATPVEVTKKNLEVALALSAGVDISGRIVPRDGVTLPALDKVQIGLLPLETGNGAKATLDAEGAFLATNVMGPSHRLRIDGLSDKYYVKEIRVDGRVASDGIVRLYQGAHLEIVLDDQPASITGLVTDGDKPFSQPLVFVAKWPSLEVMARPTSGTNEGQFQVTGLAPGEYRVVAVPSTALPDGQQIWEGMLGRLWSTAEKVTLEREARRAFR